MGRRITVQSLHLQSTFSISIFTFFFIMFVFFKVQTAKISVFPLPMHTHIEIITFAINLRFLLRVTLTNKKKIINYYRIENSRPDIIILNHTPEDANI